MQNSPEVSVTSIGQLKSACATCSMNELCLPMGLSETDIAQLDEIIGHRQRLRRGEYLYRLGDAFRSLYAVRAGSFKTTHLAQDGNEKITGFIMSGELLGMDAISTDMHNYDAIALEDASVCVIPFQKLESLTREIPALQRQFHKLMSKEIMRDQGLMLLLGGMKADERLAAFLLSLSQRYSARGYSPSRFVLRLTRQEIGNYLGLTLETVSRLFSRLQQQGLLAIHHKDVELKDLSALHRLVEHHANCD